MLRKDTSVISLALLVSLAPVSSSLAASPSELAFRATLGAAETAARVVLLSSTAAGTVITNDIGSRADRELVSDSGSLVDQTGVAIASSNSGSNGANEDSADFPVWGWLLPLALLGGLLWWLLRKRTESDLNETNSTVSPVAPVASHTAPSPVASPVVSGMSGSSTSSLTLEETDSPRSSSVMEASGSVNTAPTVGVSLAGGAAAAARLSASDRPDAIPNYQAFYNRGMVLAESGHYEDAIVSFDRAIEVKPDFFAAWASKGDALLSVDRPEEAIASFDRAIELDAALDDSTAKLPGQSGGIALAATWAGKGNALANLGRVEEAIASFDQALEIEPHYAEAQASRNALLASLSTIAAQAEPDLPDPSPESVEDVPQVRTQIGGAALAAGAAAWSAMPNDRIHDKMQSDVESAKFNVGQTDEVESLAAVDEDLDDLPEGYGESRIVLMPRDPQWAYAYWDIPAEHKEELRRQGGSYLALRLYDVTDIDLNHQNPHSLQQFGCEEMARDWYLAIPVSDRDYIIEIGYITNDSDWLMLARSAPTRIPPTYPSDWFEDQFLTLSWDEDPRSKTFLTLIPPHLQSAAAAGESTPYTTLFGLAQSAESMRVAGSLFGSMQQVPQQAISSYIFPSGAALWALPTLSGIGMSGIGMSGAGFPTSIPPIRPRQFWLVADAELIVYGATEPDATVTIDGQPIQLNPDGTFRFQISFQDGVINYPIIAIDVDGEQSRSIHMEFERETPERNINTKDEATDEWLE